MSGRGTQRGAIREVGQTIDGKFRLVALIGSGSTGHVFRAIRFPTIDSVALKVLDPALSRDVRQVERFRREVAVCTRLRHPNVVRVVDHGRFIDGRLYIAMEYLEGQTLSSLLRAERPLPVVRACNVVRQVAEALNEAHRLGIVHRDLKPDNIFLAKVGRALDFVKILDFGIARFVGDDAVQQTLTRAGFVAGTPLYLSPEQGLGKRLDGRSDLYSLGLVLYETVVGRPPFIAEKPVAVVLKHIHEQPPPPSVVNPDIKLPEELERLILALLAKDPKERPQSAADVSILLEEIESIAHERAPDDIIPRAIIRTGEIAPPSLSRMHALPLTVVRRWKKAQAIEDDEEAFQELAAVLRGAMGGEELEALDERQAGAAEEEPGTGLNGGPPPPGEMPVVVLRTDPDATAAGKISLGEISSASPLRPEPWPAADRSGVPDDTDDTDDTDETSEAATLLRGKAPPLGSQAPRVGGAATPAGPPEEEIGADAALRPRPEETGGPAPTQDAAGPEEQDETGSDAESGARYTDEAAASGEDAAAEISSASEPAPDAGEGPPDGGISFPNDFPEQGRDGAAAAPEARERPAAGERRLLLFALLLLLLGVAVALAWYWWTSLS